MRGFYNDNFVDFDDLNELNRKDNSKSLVGIVYKKFIIKNSLLLKLLDFENMIDTHKVYINFKGAKLFDKMNELI